MSVMGEIDKHSELFGRKRPEEPLKYWVRERPAGARGKKVEYYTIFYGPRGCSYGTLPFAFTHWEAAQSFANAMQSNRPDEKQIADYIRGGG